MYPTAEIDLRALLALSIIVACGFLYRFSLILSRQNTIIDPWKEKRSEGSGTESEPSSIKTEPSSVRTEQSSISKQISLVLSIDKQTGRVLFAESKKDFVEVLFSFLTLPLGEIVRLCGKESGIPPLNNLYASVEALDVQSFQTAASKNMLLHPRSAHRHRSTLAIEIDQKEPSLHYICSRDGCTDENGFRFVSLVKGAECRCKRTMEKEICVKKMIADNVEGFLEDQGKFIISDDLVVLPSKVQNIQKLITREMNRSPDTEVKEITIGTKEVLQILKHLTSRRPLTSALLRDNCELGPSSIINWTAGQFPMLTGCEGRLGTSLRKLQCIPTEKVGGNLLVERSTGKIIGLEAQEDLADFMFSFLVIPLGSVVKLHSKQASVLGCISNLYSSIEQLHVDCFKSERSKYILLSPKTAPNYDCKSRLLKIDKETVPRFDPRGRYTYMCYECFLKKIYCRHGSYERIALINPKIPGQVTMGGGFLKKKGSLIITNDLKVEYLQPAIHLRQVNPLDLDVITFDLDEVKAFKILSYLMTSTNVLANALHDVTVLSKERMPTYPLGN